MPLLPLSTVSGELHKEVLEENPDAKVDHHHANFLKQWWLLGWARAEMIQKITKLTRCISCGQVTKRPIFEFISKTIRPKAACIVLPFADDYSFGILQSGIHWAWFTAKCSTLTEGFRYTSDTVFDTFPWPQAPTLKQIRAAYGMKERKTSSPSCSNRIWNSPNWKPKANPSPRPACPRPFRSPLTS